MWEESFKNEKWSKNDEHLLTDRFTLLNKKWCFENALTSDYERRQALIELDVMAAISLGMTLDQLISIYNSQFFVLQSYDSETWFDKNGNIAFTNNRSLIGVGLDKSTWERVKDATNGSFSKTFMDDTMPGGPVERTITYVAPFTKCDRVEDYKTAWEFFTKKYGEVNE